MANYPNWFEPYARPLFEKYLLPLAGKPGLRFLQIGVFTGDASVWLLDNVLTGEGSWLEDVDTWGGSSEHDEMGFDWEDVRSLYNERTLEAYDAGRLSTHDAASREFFWRAYINEWRAAYDFIYVDGDHTAETVAHDGAQGFSLLKPGGLLAFDDYNWGHPSGDPAMTPRPAIDAFMREHASEIELVEVSAQVWVRKR